MTNMMTESVSLPEALGAYVSLVARLDRREAVDARISGLVDQAALVWSRPGFDVLLSRATLRFEPFEHQVQASVTGTGQGTIAADRPGALDVGIFVNQGTPVTLTAAPQAGSVFAGWRGDTTTTNASASADALRTTPGRADRERGPRSPRD